MKIPFKSEHIKLIIAVLFVALVAKIFWLIVELVFLGQQGVENTKSSKVKALYYRTKFVTAPTNKSVEKKVVMSDINSFKLLAIYNSKDSTVVTISKNSKNFILSRGEEIDGYKLESATATEAIFSKDAQMYRLRLTKLTEAQGAENGVRYLPAQESQPSNAQPANPSNDKEPPVGEIIEGEGNTIIQKNLVSYYGNNMNAIWKDIALDDVIENRQLKGFRVSFIRRGSNFSKLGLQRGDILIRANGEDLTSYNSAFELYRNINTMENLTLTVKRGNEEKDLNYEIN